MALLVVAAIGVGVSELQEVDDAATSSFDEARQSTGSCRSTACSPDKNYVMKPNEQYLEFQLKDARGEIMTVEYRGAIPGNFDPGDVGGRDRPIREQSLRGRARSLVKCPSKYQTEAEQESDVTT